MKFAQEALDLDLKNLVPPWQFEFSAFQCPAVVNSSMLHLLKHILYVQKAAVVNMTWRSRLDSPGDLESDIFAATAFYRFRSANVRQ